METIAYRKSLEPVEDMISSMESLLGGAVGSANGDQRECFKRLHANAWALHAQTMDVITLLGPENISTSQYLAEQYKIVLGAVQTELDHLSAGYDGELDEEQAMLLDFTRRAFDSFQRRIRCVGVYSMLYHNMIDFQINTCNLDEVLRGARRTLGDDNLLLEQGAAQLCGDQFWLTYAFDELAINARQHGDGSPVRIETRRQANRLAITMSNGGRGFAASEAENAFTPFWQADESSAGLGLGLFLARSLVRGCDGEISIQSRPHRGARVTVLLPVPVSTPVVTA